MRGLRRQIAEVREPAAVDVESCGATALGSVARKDLAGGLHADESCRLALGDSEAPAAGRGGEAGGAGKVELLV